MKGWQGWDDYAPFYDWENAQTMGRRDVTFWRRVARETAGPILELGCGTGRVSLPVARDGARIVGVDRSAAMLARARKRLHRSKLGGRLDLVRADITALPFEDRTFSLVMAPYGILQSLLDDAVVDATLGEIRRVLTKGGTFGIDLVADLQKWPQYRKRLKLRGRRGTGQTFVTLVESVRQEQSARLTIFEQEFTERRGTDVRRHQFSLAFRTLPMDDMSRRLERSGFRVRARLGDYEGGAWSHHSDVWIVLAE